MQNKGKVVLVIEDNESNMRLLNDLLQAQGYRTLQARNGRDGFEIACQHHPDLILMDVQLPDVSGLEVTAWLKNDDAAKSIPIVAVTAFAMFGDEKKILDAGCDAYISKPITVPDFIETIEGALAGWEYRSVERELETAQRLELAPLGYFSKTTSEALD